MIDFVVIYPFNNVIILYRYYSWEKYVLLSVERDGGIAVELSDCAEIFISGAFEFPVFKPVFRLVIVRIRMTRTNTPR